MKREKSTEQRLRCSVLFFGAGSGRRRFGVGACGREGWVQAGGNVKILLPETEAQGFAGSGEQRGEAAGSWDGRNPAAGM